MTSCKNFNKQKFTMINTYISPECCRRSQDLFSSKLPKANLSMAWTWVGGPMSPSHQFWIGLPFQLQVWWPSVHECGKAL